ncbi:MAG: TonB family protein [Chitinophagaceae bacterium]
MIRFLLPGVLLLLAITGTAQKDSVRKYLDGDLRFTNKRNAVYAAMALKNNDHWVLHAVYPDTNVLLRVSFKNAALTIKDGSFVLYHPKKIPAQRGFFKDNVANGQWQTWYSNGQQKNEGAIINNHFAGIWKYWFDNGQLMQQRSYGYTEPMAGAPVHENSPALQADKIMEDFAPEGQLEGTSTAWYKNGNKESVLNYHNDSLAGECLWFRENGNPSSKETYLNGKVTALECFDSSGKYTGATCSILKLPLLIHPFFTALDYLEYELHQEKHRNIAEGDAAVSFTVTKNGTVENIVITSSPDPELNKLILKIFAAMPAWSPAVIHNRAVDYPVQMEVPYYRD